MLDRAGGLYRLLIYIGVASERRAAAGVAVMLKKVLKTGYIATSL